MDFSEANMVFPKMLQMAVQHIVPLDMKGVPATLLRGRYIPLYPRGRYVNGYLK